MVVYGQDVLDEISLSAPTTICEVKDGSFSSYTISPQQFGYEMCRKEELEGGAPKENAGIIRDILDGRKGPKRNAVTMNAGAGLYVAGKAASIEEGVRLAEQLIDSGAAKRRLEEFIRLSNA